MWRKKLQLSALLLLGFGLTGLQAQTMYVKQSNDLQTTYALSNVRKMTFLSGNLTVTKTDNSSGVYALSNMRYLNFSDLTSGIEDPLRIQEQKLNAYPNPVSNVLNIDLAGTVEGEGTLSIISFEGKTVLSQQVSHAGVLTLDLSHLPKGIYIYQYRNATQLKAGKIIKQ